MATPPDEKTIDALMKAIVGLWEDDIMNNGNCDPENGFSALVAESSEASEQAIADAKLHGTGWMVQGGLLGAAGALTRVAPGEVRYIPLPAFKRWEAAQIKPGPGYVVNAPLPAATSLGALQPAEEPFRIMAAKSDHTSNGEPVSVIFNTSPVPEGMSGSWSVPHNPDIWEMPDQKTKILMRGFAYETEIDNGVVSLEDVNGWTKAPMDNVWYDPRRWRDAGEAMRAADSGYVAMPAASPAGDVAVAEQMREAGGRCAGSIYGCSDQAVLGAVCERIFRAMYAAQPPVQNELTLAWQEGNKAAWKQAERDIAAARQERDAYALEARRLNADLVTFQKVTPGAWTDQSVAALDEQRKLAIQEIDRLKGDVQRANRTINSLREERDAAVDLQQDILVRCENELKAMYPIVTVQPGDAPGEIHWHFPPRAPLSYGWHWMAEFTDPVTDGLKPPVDPKEHALANALRPRTGDRRMIGR